MVARKIIVKGLTSSIGWNLGKKNKSSQRFDPLTSAPIIGTNAKKMKENMNSGIIIFFKKEVSIAEIIIIIIKAKVVKIKCFEKKK